MSIGSRAMYKNIQFDNKETLQELVAQSIKNKDTTLQLYNALVDAAPDFFTKSILSRIYAYEYNLLKDLNNFYVLNFGSLPSYTVDPIETAFDTFEDGLVNALVFEANQVAYEIEMIDLLNSSDLEIDIYRNGLELYKKAQALDTEEQVLLNATFTHYLHFFAPAPSEPMP
jgi:hypothetical protein